MKRYLLFKAILTLLFIFPQETLAFSPDDTLVCGGRAYAISAPLTYWVGQSRDIDFIL